MNNKEDSLTIYNDDKMWLRVINKYITLCIRRLEGEKPLMVFYTKVDKKLYCGGRLYYYPHSYTYAAYDNLFKPFRPSRTVSAKSGSKILINK